MINEEELDRQILEYERQLIQRKRQLVEEVELIRLIDGSRTYSRT